LLVSPWSHISNSPERKHDIKSDKLAAKVFLAELAQKNLSPDYKILLSELVDILTGPQFGFSQLEAAQTLRWLVESEKRLVPVENIGLVLFTLNRSISEYQARQQRLQEAYLHVDEAAAKQCLHEEVDEIEKATILKEESKRFHSYDTRWKKKQGGKGGKRSK
jgi:hypothetical protein